MFKPAIFFTISLFVTIIACEPSSKKQKAKNIVIVDTENFYPIDNFIAEQMKYVDLRNFKIQKTIDSGLLKNSNPIDKETFLVAASKILSLSKEFINNKQLYKEVVFQDLSTDSYTINYTTINASIPLQRIDILLSEQTKMVKRVLMRKVSEANGIITTQQINWETDHQFQVIISKEIANKISTVSTSISWNKPIN